MENTNTPENLALYQSKYRFFIILLILISIVGYILISFFRNLNIQNRDYGIENFDATTIPSKLLPPVISSFYLENESSKYFLTRPYGTGSFIDTEIDSMEGIKDIIKNKHFGEFDILAYLSIYKKDKEINQIIDSVLKKEMLGDGKIDLYIDFIDKYYMKPAIFSLNQKQYLQARIFIDKAYDLLKKIDTEPLNNLPVKSNSIISQILLSKVLLNDLYSVYLNNKYINTIFPQIDKNNEIYIIKKFENGIDSKFHYYEAYMLGLTKFKKKEYAISINAFAEASKSASIILKDLSNLMLVRCLVWDCIEKKFTNKKSVIKSISKIKYSIIDRS